MVNVIPSQLKCPIAEGLTSLPAANTAKTNRLTDSSVSIVNSLGVRQPTNI